MVLSDSQKPGRNLNNIYFFVHLNSERNKRFVNFVLSYESSRNLIMSSLYAIPDLITIQATTMRIPQ